MLKYVNFIIQIVHKNDDTIGELRANVGDNHQHKIPTANGCWRRNNDEKLEGRDKWINEIREYLKKKCSNFDNENEAEQIVRPKKVSPKKTGSNTGK